MPARRARPGGAQGGPETSTEEIRGPQIACLNGGPGAPSVLTQPVRGAAPPLPKGNGIAIGHPPSPNARAKTLSICANLITTLLTIYMEFTRELAHATLNQHCGSISRFPCAILCIPSFLLLFGLVHSLFDCLQVRESSIGVCRYLNGFFLSGLR
jgi:hypothetical protein